MPGQLHDLAGRAVGDLERLDRDVGQAGVGEQLRPVDEAVVEDHLLRLVAGDRDAATGGDAVEQHADLERAQVLGLVDHDVLVLEAVALDEEPALLGLHQADEHGVVLAVERGRRLGHVHDLGVFVLVGLARGLVLALAPLDEGRGLLAAPADDRVEVLLVEHARHVALERAADPLGVAEELDPVVGDLVDALSKAAQDRLGRGPGLGRQVLALALEQPLQGSPRAGARRQLGEAAPVREHLARALLGQRVIDRLEILGDQLVDHLHDDRVLLEAHDRLGGLLGPLGRQVELEPLEQGRAPASVGRDGHALDPERRQHVADVFDQRLVEDDDQHLVGREAARILEGQVGDAVQRDGGLARAGATLDQHDPGLGPGDQLELLLVDQRGDLLQALVGPAEILVVDAESTSRHAHGRSAATGQGRSVLLRQLLPGPAPGLDPRALRRVDPAQLAAVDDQAAPNQHLALDVAVVELLLVLVVLVVAVVEPADRGVAPVDDREPVAVVEHGPLADQHVATLAAPAFLDPQMTEVGVAGIDRHRAARAALGVERRELVHLIEQRGQVLFLGLGDLVAQRDQVAVEVVELVDARGRVLLDARADAIEDAQLFVDDRLAAGIERVGDVGREGLGCLASLGRLASLARAPSALEHEFGLFRHDRGQ